MRYLLDTHTFLWLMQTPEMLPSRVLQALESPDNRAYVSHATLWEIAIKVSMKRLYIPSEYDELFPQSVFAAGMRLLQITPEHISAVVKLPIHHRDPFDRMIIAQAQVEGLTLVSVDDQFPQYGVDVFWG